MMIDIIRAALQSPTYRETRTREGWPFARHEMRSARRIRERIAEDAETLLASGETVLTTDDFLRLGWRREQLAAHGAEAMRLLSGENACGNDTPQQVPA